MAAEFNLGTGWLPYTSPIEIFEGEHLEIRGNLTWISGPKVTDNNCQDFSTLPVGEYVLRDVGRIEVRINKRTANDLDGYIDLAFRAMKFDLLSVWEKEDYAGIQDIEKEYYKFLAIWYSIIVYLYSQRKFYEKLPFDLECVREGLACKDIDFDNAYDQFPIPESRIDTRVRPDVGAYKALFKKDVCICTIGEPVQLAPPPVVEDNNFLVTTTTREAIILTTTREKIRYTQ